jgi:hypothetical protein
VPEVGALVEEGGELAEMAKALMEVGEWGALVMMVEAREPKKQQRVLSLWLKPNKHRTASSLRSIAQASLYCAGAQLSTLECSTIA